LEGQIRGGNRESLTETYLEQVGGYTAWCLLGDLATFQEGLDALRVRKGAAPLKMLRRIKGPRHRRPQSKHKGGRRMHAKSLSGDIPKTRQKERLDEGNDTHWHDLPGVY
jgi:hypothetical protein